jgi:hypothetical protein
MFTVVAGLAHQEHLAKTLRLSQPFFVADQVLVYTYVTALALAVLHRLQHPRATPGRALRPGLQYFLHQSLAHNR